jgi:outer membrane protein OmpA-like peptidoglycan-associated protein
MTNNSNTETTSRSSAGPWVLALGVVLLLALVGVGLIGYRILERLDSVESQVSTLNTQAIEATDASEKALDRSERAAQAARAAAQGRLLAEEESARAEETAALARDDARLSRAEAEEARQEAERIRKEAEAELDRLENALGKIAETRRTALGLVMNLGEDSLKFDFDKAELKQENKELLSRVAGVLMTSVDYTVAVNGHTDDVGSVDYNLDLSERRAMSVRNYLVEVGIDEAILSVEAFGKSQPLIQGTSDEARTKNRRVELGIVNTRIKYPSAR